MIGSTGAFLFLSACIFNTGQCNGINSLEFSPFYDAIIFGDIADIIKDIDNNMNSDIDRKFNSESESDEEVEKLLSEYQHYLEKAEKQRTKYFEKTKGKNKVPLLRHERFSKVNFPKTHSDDRNPNYYTSNIQFSPNAYKYPYDLFTPIQLAPKDNVFPFNKIIWKDNKIKDFSTSSHQQGADVMLSSYYCEENKFPCKCNCKQCIIPLGKKLGPYFEPAKIKNNPLTTSDGLYKNMGYFNENTDNNSEKNMNIRIKFDIQLTKIDDVLKRLIKCPSKTTELAKTDITEAVTPLNISFPALDFPIPLNIFTYGIPKLHNYDYGPIHKISVHKKKKTHTNNQNKKHRSKFLTLYRGKSNPSLNILTPELFTNDSHNFNNVTQGKVKTQLNLEVLELNITSNTSDVNSANHNYTSNMSQYANVSSDDNNIETDTTTQENTQYTRLEQNNTTDISHVMRIKREKKIETIDSDSLSNKELLKAKGIDHETSTRIDKRLLQDSDLLYWPSTAGDNNKKLTITVRSVESHKDVKATANTRNLTTSWHKPLSKINWKDIDIVASTFSTLVGKYVNGILTFCSEKQCRSLKCAEKICVHRSCHSQERYHLRGHCSLAPNATDATVSMESNMEASFDNVWELIETLQNQMLGSTYGKATLCVNTKCITLVANKKLFSKTKCSKKKLKSDEHCESLKNFKLV